MEKTNPTLRVAILCRGYSFETWEATCIREVLSLSSIEVVLLIEESIEETPSKGFLNKLVHYPYRNFLWRYYNRFHLKVKAFKKTCLEMELENIPHIQCKPELKGKYSQHFSAADIEKVKSHRPDVILRFGFNILRGEILDVAPHGIWSYHHADEQIIRGGPAAFWEIKKRIPVTGAILQRLTDKLDAGIILKKGYFPTILRSYNANLEQLVNGTSSWMKQALIDVTNGVSPSQSNSPIQSSAKVYSFPTNLQMLSAWGITKIEKLKFHWGELMAPEQWNIGIIRKSPSDIIANGIPNEMKWLKEPASNEYFADPFGWYEKEDLKIVFEYYNYSTQKGILAITNGKGEIKPLLEAKVHLSYPFVIERKDEKETNHVILPECHLSGNVFCFDSSNPKNGTILIENLPAIDPTTIFHNNKWWLFCTLEGDFNNTNLHIYHANELNGEWKAHGNNPVKCDVRSARPGGTPFLLDGKLFRPSQDCSTSYGSAIVINEIVELTATSFVEKSISRIEPDKNWNFNKGLHTFSIIDNNTVLIDAKRYKFNLDNFKHILRRKLRRLFN